MFVVVVFLGVAAAGWFSSAPPAEKQRAGDVTSAAEQWAVQQQQQQRPESVDMTTIIKLYQQASSEGNTEVALDSRCVLNTAMALTDRCYKMTEEDQRHLAIDLTNCHFERSGKEVYPCSHAIDSKTCTAPMSPMAFSAFTVFLTHTMNICRDLQEQVSRAATHNALLKLTSATLNTAGSLNSLQQSVNQGIVKTGEAFRSIHEVLLEQERIALSQLLQLKEQGVSTMKEFDKIGTAQKDFAQAQEKMATEGRAAMQNIIDSVMHTSKGLQELGKDMEKAAGYNAKIMETQERIKTLQEEQTKAMNDITKISQYMFGIAGSIWYFSAAAVSLLLTSTPMTGRARLGVVLVLVCTYVCEIILSFSPFALVLTSILHWSYYVFIIVYTIYAGTRYKDPTAETTSLLRDLLNQLSSRV